MFFLIRILVWLIGFLFLAHFVLNFFGYDINTKYFQAHSQSCQDQLVACQKNLVSSGVEGAKNTCVLDCLDPKLFIHKEP